MNKIMVETEHSEVNSLNLRFFHLASALVLPGSDLRFQMGVSQVAGPLQRHSLGVLLPSTS